jgi:plastocyanin
MPIITPALGARAATLAVALALGVAMTTSALASPVRPATVAVAIVEPDYDATDTWTYEPNAVTIHPGDSVVWTNKGSDWHDVNAEDGSFSSGADGTLGPGDTFTYTFTQAGSFGYLCNVHPWMRGKVVVQ